MESSNRSATTKTKRAMTGSWKNHLGELPALPYFKSCKTIASFDYIDFLKSTERQRLTKDQCESQWNDSLDKLIMGKHVGLRKRAEFLKTQWTNKAHADDAHVFWSKVKRKRGLDKGTLEVQATVDTYWNKRIQDEYWQEMDNVSANSSAAQLKAPPRSPLSEHRNAHAPSSSLNSQALGQDSTGILSAADRGRLHGALNNDSSRVLKTPRIQVCADRSEESPWFHETEYENDYDEDDEGDDGLADAVCFRSSDRMPARHISPGQTAVSVMNSESFSRPNWTAPSTLPASSESYSRTGVTSTTSTKYAKDLSEQPSSTHKIPAPKSGIFHKNVVLIENAVNKRKQPTEDEGSENRTATADSRNDIAVGGRAYPQYPQNSESHERNDDFSPDIEFNDHNSNIQPSSPTKERKGSKLFTDDRRKSLQRRYSSLGRKWTLASGAVVEDVLFEAGKQMKDFHPIHSFMLDMSDRITRELFSKDEWSEICNNLPSVSPYSKEASDYLDKFDNVATLEDLQALLDYRPRHVECQLIHECLMNWLCMYETDDPSPFNVAGSLSENWWLKSAWGVCTNLAKGVPGCFIIPGEVTGHDSSARRNHDRESTCGNERKRIGVRADLVWRTITSPETDWAIAEAAKVWCPQSNKYISESKFKLPRQLHDVLVGRTMEVGGASELRDVLVSGLIIGGPCLQRVGLCWGAAGDNVTRLIKMEATRLEARVSHMSTSLQAVHELLCFRTSTIQLISRYEQAAKRHSQQRRRDRHRNLASALLEPRTSRPNLLQSSP